MKFRPFDRTGFSASEIGLGCWQLGGNWGSVPEKTAMEILETAFEHGVNFFDTADVYGGGRSESLIGKFLQQHRDDRDDLFVATKVGRDGSLYPDHYTKENVQKCLYGSLERLGVDVLDLVQLHCVPTEIMQDGEIFEWLRDFQKQGLLKHFGASVESMHEANLCMQQDDLTSLQIIFNIFRQKPIHTLFDTAQANQVALVVRLPLASGLLSGKFDRNTSFEEDDHRRFNRDGEMFNVGETFAGLPFEKGVELADDLKELLPDNLPMAAWTMRWILDHDAVSVVIPGASKPGQARQNAAVSDVKPLSDELHQQLAQFYESKVKQHIRGPY
jgi:aryl-alcohol dehydrogenase-like predicted oxidoreductase